MREREGGLVARAKEGRPGGGMPPQREASGEKMKKTRCEGFHSSFPASGQERRGQTLSHANPRHAELFSRFSKRKERKEEREEDGEELEVPPVSARKLAVELEQEEATSEREGEREEKSICSSSFRLTAFSTRRNRTQARRPARAARGAEEHAMVSWREDFTLKRGEKEKKKREQDDLQHCLSLERLASFGYGPPSAHARSRDGRRCLFPCPLIR